jgi:serine/threonine protein kinase
MALTNLPKALQDVHLEKKLGKGFFGEVHRAKETGPAQRIFAVKKVGLRLIEQNRLTEQLRREINILYALEHPRIIRLYFDFDDGVSMYLGMEFAEGGNLFEKLSRQTQGFPASVASRYFCETCEALEYLHHLPEKVIHRDIKPENILLDKEDHIKLADFGWANLIPADHPSRDTFCGTLDYLPPEMIMGTGHDESADMWTMGVLTYELTTGKSPFGADSKEQTCRLILGIELKFPGDLDADAKHLVVSLCKKKPSERLPVRSALKHPFVTKFNENRSAAATGNDAGGDSPDRPSVAARKLQKDYEKMEAEMDQLLEAKKCTEASLESVVAEHEQFREAIQKERHLRSQAEALCKELGQRVSARDVELEQLRQKVKALNAEVEGSPPDAAGYPTTPEKRTSILDKVFRR